VTNETNTPSVWYIVKHQDGYCEITAMPGDEQQRAGDGAEPAPLEQWGPFATQGEATARRVGLIRAGKCLPR
jgi:hypothetical protein